MMKRALHLILLSSLACSALAGAQGAIERIPEGYFLLTEEPKTLKVFMGGNASVENFATNTFTQWYEEKTNVKIDFNIAAGSAQDVTQALNLMLASGDLPDVILSGGVSTSQLVLYGQQGTFLPLNDLIEKVGVETQQVFELYPEYKEAATAPDGNIYALPEINVCYHCGFSGKMWIYKPWLDALGLEMPTTT